MAAEASKRQTMGMLMTMFLMLGLLFIAAAGMIWAYSFTQGDPAGNPPISSWDASNYRNVYAPIVWNLGMFLLIFGIWGTAMMRQDMDPMARLLMYLVAFILILLIFVAPTLFFRGVP